MVCNVAARGRLAQSVVVVVLTVWLLWLVLRTHTKFTDNSASQQNRWVGPKKVILYSYMRGGSTFLGSLFEQHPHAIYWYEGMAPFYRQYLQTKGSPTNAIWFNMEQNYTLRELSDIEKDGIAEHLYKLLDCQVGHMYPEGVRTILLRHNPVTSKLVKCAASEDKCEDSDNKDLKLQRCSSPSLNERMEQGCYNTAIQARHCWLDKDHCETTELDADVKTLLRKLKCYGNGKKGLPSCVGKFEEMCTRYHIRVTKVHRLSMQAVSHVIRDTPDVRIIYYVRDPRGVWSSREEQDLNVPIQALCAQMHQDHLLYKQLSRTHPGVFLKVRYEDLAAYPQQTAQRIYQHIGEYMPDKIKGYLSTITRSDGVKETAHSVARKDSNQTATAWRLRMTPLQMAQAQTHCSTTLKELGYAL